MMRKQVGGLHSFWSIGYEEVATRLLDRYLLSLVTLTEHASGRQSWICQVQRDGDADEWQQNPAKRTLTVGLAAAGEQIERERERETCRHAPEGGNHARSD